MLWGGSSYTICICTKGSRKSKMLIRTSQLFRVIKHLEYCISVAHWGKWMRILAVRGNHPKVPDRPVSGQTCNLFTAQQCAYDGNLHYLWDFPFFLWIVCIPSFWNHQFIRLAFFPPKEKFIFSLLIHKTDLGYGDGKMTDSVFRLPGFMYRHCSYAACVQVLSPVTCNLTTFPLNDNYNRTVLWGCYEIVPVNHLRTVPIA